MRGFMGKWRSRFGVYYDFEDEAEDDEIDGDGDDDYAQSVHVPEEPTVIFGRKINTVLFEMYLGLLTYGLACQLSVVWFLQDKLSYSLGLWLGIVTAGAYIAHIWWSIEQYLYRGEKAAGVARGYTLIRYLAVAAVLVAATFTDSLQLFAVFLGIIGVKIAALLQPQVRKLRRRRGTIPPAP